MGYPNTMKIKKSTMIKILIFTHKLLVQNNVNTFLMTCVSFHMHVHASVKVSVN